MSSFSLSLSSMSQFSLIFLQFVAKYTEKILRIFHLNLPNQRDNYPTSPLTLSLPLLLLFFPTMFFSSLFLPPTDCDEIFNYWEIIHFLHHKFGFQTWEYAPQYALRSYLYLLPITVISIIAEKGMEGMSWIIAMSTQIPVDFPKYFQFYFIRIVISFSSALVMGHFVKSFYYQIQNIYLMMERERERERTRSTKTMTITRTDNKRKVSFSLSDTDSDSDSTSLFLRCSFHLSILTLLCVLSLSCGMFISLSSLLPQTFTMCTLTMAISFWMRNRYSTCIILCGISILIGWPFIAVAILPIGIDILWRAMRDNRNSQGGISFIYRFVSSLLPTILLTFVVTFILILSTVLVDYYFYGFLVFAPLNIFSYNSNQSEGAVGANLYGVESHTFYAKNLFLNFNFAFIFAMGTPVAIVGMGVHHFYNQYSKRTETREHSSSYSFTPLISLLFSLLKSISPFFFWFVPLTLMPHKEERFLFAVYPLLAMAAATAVLTGMSAIQMAMSSGRKGETERKQHDANSNINESFHDLHVESNQSNIVSRSRSISRSRGSRSISMDNVRVPPPSHSHSLSILPLIRMFFLLFVLLFLVIFSLLSASRITSLLVNYGSVMNIWEDTYEWTNKESGHGSGTVSLCVGKEWYRFPSSYFLPPHVRLHFVPSGFDGLLPSHFNESVSLPYATSLFAPNQNLLNREELSRYLPFSQCEYFIDLDIKKYHKRENYAKEVETEFDIVKERLFFANEKSDGSESISNTFHRAFWTPWALETNQKQFYNYSLYQRRRDDNGK